VDANLTTEQCKPEKIVNRNVSGETTHAILLPEHITAAEDSLFTLSVLTTFGPVKGNKIGEKEQSNRGAPKTRYKSSATGLNANLIFAVDDAAAPACRVPVSGILHCLSPLPAAAPTQLSSRKAKKQRPCAHIPARRNLVRSRTIFAAFRSSAAAHHPPTAARLSQPPGCLPLISQFCNCWIRYILESQDRIIKKKKGPSSRLVEYLPRRAGTRNRPPAGTLGSLWGAITDCHDGSVKMDQRACTITST